ncbi:MAG: glycoside hydrolase family 2 TIM barrel-domain containing protein [Limisphaerales bacterium]
MRLPKVVESFLTTHKLRRLLCCLGGVAVAIAAGLNAVATVIPSESNYVKSLDGTWRFKIEQIASDTARGYQEKGKPPVEYPATFEPFQKPDYIEGNGWTNLGVPGNWEMAGLSPATYNQPDNTSGFYRLWFEIPKSWEGRDVYLNFDGVQNGAEIWLNGKPVAVDEPSWGRENYHESGWTAFQVNLTPQVKFGEKNLLALRVTKNTRSADLDSGDFFFLGGINRPVTLFSVPKTHLADVTVQTHLLNGNRAEIKVLADIIGNNAANVSMQLGGVAGEATSKVESGHAVLTQIVEQPKLWSAEFPNLYNLTMELKDTSGQITETVSKRIGIREVTITNGVLLINGVPVKFAGICRHDISATEGTAVGPDLWRKDITMMKAANINAIRTSHYPYGSGFYDLCDQLGMYVVDELPYCWCHRDCNDPEMQPAFEQRARETIRRDKNHPSVIIWTIGNENTAGTNLQVVANLVKQLDSTRPRNVSCFDGGKYNVELSDSHYPRVAKIVQDVARSRETGRPHIYLESPNTWEIRRAADPGAWVRWGTVLQRVWDVCMKYDTIPGTFLWEWQDRAIADHSPVKLYSYFPDTGIQLVKIKGLVDGYRNPRPWLYDVKMIYSPIQIGNGFTTSGDKISFPIENHYSFTDLSYLKMTWTLEREGKTIASGDSRVNLPPRSSGEAEISLPADALAQADALRVDFIHPDGDDVVAHRFTLKDVPPTSKMVSALPTDLQIPQFNLITHASKSKLWNTVARFPARLANIVVEPASATTLAELKQLDADVIGGPKNQLVGRIHAQFNNGEFSYSLNWTGGNSEVQELGWTFQMPKDCDHFSWDRAARWTIYPASNIGRADGTATPDSMNVPITRMNRPDAFDFNSTKYDCNWASLTTAEGRGLRVEFEPQHRFHCRAGVAKGGHGYVLFVNQQVSPPDDISKSIVPDFYMTLKKDDKIQGRFRVGSNQINLADSSN